MKKILSVLGTMILMTTAETSITACENNLNPQITNLNLNNDNKFIEFIKVKKEITDLTLYKSNEKIIIYTTWTGDGYGRIYQVNNISKEVKLIAKLNGEILSLVVASNGIIYASTTGMGTGYGYLYQINKTNFNKISEMNDLIESLAIDKNNNVYAGSDHGIIYKKNNNKQIFEKIMSCSGEILSLVVASNGNVYAGVVYYSSILNSKIYKSIDGINFAEIKTINNEIQNLIIDSNGNIYADFVNGNVYRCLSKQIKFNKITTINDKISSLAIDKDGNVYAVTWKGNLYKGKVSGDLELVTGWNVSNGTVTSLVNVNDTIYVGVVNNKFYKILKIKK